VLVARPVRGGADAVVVPDGLAAVIAEVAIQARASELVDQRSGDCARTTIALLENVVSSAERRALLAGEKATVARVADVAAASSAVTGKVELVYEGEREGPAAVARHLLNKAVKAVFDERFPDAYATGAGSAEGEFKPVLEHFQGGRSLDVADDLADEDLYARLSDVPALEAVAVKYLRTEGWRRAGAAMEFVLDGLHASSLLAKDEVVGSRAYRDMFEDMVKDLDDKPRRRRAEG
jgi:magnesium chelatase subunit I